MDNRKFICTTEDVGSRLDVFLAKNIEGISRSAVQNAISDKLVSVNEKIANKKNMLLDEGMVIECDARMLESLCAVNGENIGNEIIPQDIPLDIVYEDESLMVVNKPQGMVVHPATSHTHGTLVNAIMHHCGDSLSDVNGAERAGIVHRIDKDTSGLLVIAKDNFSHNHLADQLKQKTTKRVYEAIVHGGFNFDEGINGGTVDKPIARHPKNRFKRAVVQGGKLAVTHYELIQQYGSYSHIKLRLETGRTHQIRVHMAHIGHPVLCDQLYGVKNEKFKHEGQILHARSLGFVHPRTEQYMEFNSELPEYFVNILTKVKSVKGRG